ncbi:MAG: hypothetical protein Q4P16_08010 [Spirochaetales bacterium]|nr:hypothetical protein [Spirochaetales bacterium]
MTKNEITEMNKKESELNSVMAWAAWFEGEESWGSDSDDGMMIKK